MIVEISTKLTFEAAHHLPMLPETHKCHRIHGHNYTIEVVLRAPIDPELGMAFDYADIDHIVDERIIAVCDHRLLNDIPGLENPTAENIAIWALAQLLQTPFPVVEVSVWETQNYRATVRA